MSIDRLRDIPLSRRDLFRWAGVAGGSLIIGGLASREAWEYLEREREYADPYKGTKIDNYLDGFVIINGFKYLKLRTAPELNPLTLRDNNAEARISGFVPTGFKVVDNPLGTPSETKGILGDLVEINSTSIIEDRYSVVTGRKTNLVTPVIIQNPGLITAPSINPTVETELWLVLKTLIRIPDRPHIENPRKVFYTVIPKVFYVNLTQEEKEAPNVGMVDRNGASLEHKLQTVEDLLVPLTMLQDGSHIKTADEQKPKSLGKVLLLEKTG